MSPRLPPRWGLAALALLLPLGGFSLLIGASPAYAAGGTIDTPGNGTVYAVDGTVRISATLTSGTNQTELRVKSPQPGSTAQVVDSGAGTLTSGTTLKYAFDTATCASFPAACSGRAEAANGVWTITLTGGASDTGTFVLRIPPRKPGSVTARADGYRAVVVSWARGEEPDLTGWTLFADGAVVSDGIGPSACSGASCSTTVTYAQDGTGSHTYELTAHRSVAPGSQDTLESAHSDPVSATLSSPPPPPPSQAPAAGSGGGGSSGGGSSGGGSATGPSPAPSSGSGGSSAGAPGGTGAPGSGGSSSAGAPTAAGPPGSAAAIVAQRRDFALSFHTFAPKLGISKLPPLPQTDPALAEAPLADGTYSSTLGYKSTVKRERVTVPGTVRRITGTVGSALDGGRLARSLAGALVLLLLAAHLRRWLGRSPTP